MLVFTLARDSAESIGAAVPRYWRGSGADPIEKDNSTAATMSRREITQRLRHVTGKKLSSMEGGVLRDEWICLLVSPAP
jgi:hypothetical protein